MSRFVSAGTDADSRPSDADADDAWVQARQEVQAQQQPKPSQQSRESGKSLYEVLEQNKAAKQEAFEEAARLKNQFRALDDDEVDFLDSVLESTRAKERAVKEETAEQLDAFRKQRSLAEQSSIDAEAQNNDQSGDTTSSGAWAIKKKKRRRDPDRTTTTTESSSASVKLRKLSSTAADVKPSPTEVVAERLDSPTATTSSKILPPSSSSLSSQQPNANAAPASTRLGLGGYSSDEDD